MTCLFSIVVKIGDSEDSKNGSLETKGSDVRLQDDDLERSPVKHITLSRAHVQSNFRFTFMTERWFKKTLRFACFLF